ncbi:CLCA_X family protein [Algibacillus agarilyticus]|uniref:CLCA_X family protein n=1 Tax=Algibacillus agarilyticus TaxID=2234133 RepID=UPI000DCFF34B|nr:CLCA_X family protein [Algibacillus agarilyticus]
MQTKTNRLNRGYYRTGPNHRNGTDVNFVDIRREFDFRCIHIGKWVTKAEQQIAANLVFDALSDLALILQVPKQVLSLRGTLSLAFGMGGQRHAHAHYDLRKKELALAKNAGGGALAHEWFHAFDHYICAKFLQLPTSRFASHAWLLSNEEVQHPLNQSLAKTFQTLFLNPMHNNQPSDYFKTAALIDNKLNHVYYALPEELSARAFEAYIQDSEISNEFLVKGTKKSKEAKAGLYPLAEHRKQIQHHFSHYFMLLGQYLARAR